MKRIALIFDTETSGFASQKKGAAGQAWIVELAILAIEFDDEPMVVSGGKLIESFHSLVRSEGRSIHPGAFAAHGITTERADMAGLDEKSVALKAATFAAHYVKSDPLNTVAVAHNYKFDIPLLNYMFSRNGLGNPLLNVPGFCTMENSTEICKLTPKRYGKFKWPKLYELHMHLFNEGFSGAHSALEDTKATARCFLHSTMQHEFRNYFKKGDEAA